LARVYSAVLLEQYLEPDTSYEQLVPDGYIWVVRDVVAVFASDDAGAALNLTDTTSVTVVYLLPPSGGGMAHWSGRQVIPTAYGLVAENGLVECSVRVSGYALTLP
jgi:hypothetical protein